MFDGSSIEGFCPDRQSRTMVLRPDLDTFRVLPTATRLGKVARVICDIYNPDGSAFAGLHAPGAAAPDSPKPRLSATR